MSVYILSWFTLQPNEGKAVWHIFGWDKKKGFLKQMSSLVCGFKKMVRPIISSMQVEVGKFPSAKLLNKKIFIILFLQFFLSSRPKNLFLSK